MEVVTIESSIWKKLNQKLELLMDLVLTLKDQQTKQVHPVSAMIGTSFITMAVACQRYNLSQPAISRYIRLYNKRRAKEGLAEMQRQKAGSSRLINELELLEAFKEKVPKPKIKGQKLY